MKVRIKKLSENAVIPAKAHKTDAGFDLVATRVERDDYGCIVYHTDLSFEIPDGYMGLIFPRSSNAKKDIVLTNSVGVVDAGFRGEVTLKFKAVAGFNRVRFTDNGEGCYIAEAYAGFVEKVDEESILDCYIYKEGDRVGQLIIMPIPDIEFEEAEELSQTDRGEGGYGSSGR